jgi:hypothetical protein
MKSYEGNWKLVYDWTVILPIHLSVYDLCMSTSNVREL